MFQVYTFLSVDIKMGNLITWVQQRVLRTFLFLKGVRGFSLGLPLGGTFVEVCSAQVNSARCLLT